MKLTTFLMFLCFYVSYSQDVKVFGIVYNEEKEPISDILISVVTKSDDMLNYQYTNSKGEFDFLVSYTEDSLLIKASALNYNEKTLPLKKGKNIFYLTFKIENLNEIVINSCYAYKSPKRVIMLL